jgi:hypothetical protein
MKVKMLEHYQDAHVHYAPGQIVEPGDMLADWLVKNNKAVKVKEQALEFEARNFDNEPQFEAPPLPKPQQFEKPQKRSRRAS